MGFPPAPQPLNRHDRRMRAGLALLGFIGCIGCAVVLSGEASRHIAQIAIRAGRAVRGDGRADLLQLQTDPCSGSLILTEGCGGTGISAASSYLPDISRLEDEVSKGSVHVVLAVISSLHPILPPTRK